MEYTLKADKSNESEVLEKVSKDTFSIKTFCESCGYTLITPFFYNGDNRLRVEPNKTNRYAPAIYSPDCFNKEFKIQTTSYGALGGDELELFMADLNCAITLVHFLKNLNLGTLPRITAE